jgi:hypothetical protein
VVIAYFVVDLALTAKGGNIPAVFTLYNKDDAGDIALTTGGIIVLVALGLDAVMSIMSLILIFTIPSPKKVAQATQKLVTAPKGKNQK